MKKTEIKKLVERAEEISLMLEAAKPLYKELDAITMALVGEGITSYNENGLQMLIVDNFVKQNTCFKVAGVKRFEMKLERQG